MSDVNSADRNEDLSLIVTGDDFRRVKLSLIQRLRRGVLLRSLKDTQSTCQMYVLARMVSMYSVGAWTRPSCNTKLLVRGL